MRETWFVLEDGRAVDPNECTFDGSGVFRHKTGLAVAKRGDAFSSRGVDVEAERAKARDLAASADKPASEDREMKPAGSGRTYRTRGKAE